MTGKKLFIENFVVYNKTDKWYRCKVINEEETMDLYPIPPRSGRRIPKHYQNPRIENEVQLMKADIDRFTKRSEGGTSVKKTPFDLTFDGKWNGQVNCFGNDVTKEFPMRMNKNNFYGRIDLDGCFLVLIGKVEASTHNVRAKMYSSESKISIELHGSIELEDKKYIMQLTHESDLVDISLPADINETLTTDPNTTGNYIIFFVDGGNQNEGAGNIDGCTEGLMQLTITNGRNQGIYGCFRNPEDSKLVIVPFDLNGSMYLCGSISPGPDIFIDGEFSSGSSSGNFTMIKNVEIDW